MIKVMFSDRNYLHFMLLIKKKILQPKAIRGGKNLFGLHFEGTVCHWRRQGRNQNKELFQKAQKHVFCWFDL